MQILKYIGAQGPVELMLRMGDGEDGVNMNVLKDVSIISQTTPAHKTSARSNNDAFIARTPSSLPCQSSTALPIVGL